MKWQYQLLAYQSTASAADVQGVLNKWGDAGWELITILKDLESRTDTLVLKRPTQNSN